MKKKGQGALEYLLILGGAIIVIAVVLILINQLTHSSEGSIVNQTATIDVLKKNFTS